MFCTGALTNSPRYIMMNNMILYAARYRQNKEENKIHLVTRKAHFLPLQSPSQKVCNYIFGFTSIDMIFAHVYHQSIPHTYNNA